MKNLKDLNITVFGDSIGKGVVTDNGKIEVVKDNAVELLEKSNLIKIDNRSIFGQSLKRISKRGLIDKYIDGVTCDKKNVVVLELGETIPISTGERCLKIQNLPIFHKPPSTNFLNFTWTLLTNC